MRWRLARARCVTQVFGLLLDARAALSFGDGHGEGAAAMAATQGSSLAAKGGFLDPCYYYEAAGYLQVR